MKIIDYEKRYGKSLVAMWRQSKHVAIDFDDPYKEEDYLVFLDQVLAKENTIKLALDKNKVLGFIAYDDQFINQLYIHVDHQGRGIGRELLTDLMKTRTSICLRVIQENTKAIIFYKKHGFVIKEAGFASEEGKKDWLMCRGI